MIRHTLLCLCFALLASSAWGQAARPALADPQKPGDTPAAPPNEATAVRVVKLTLSPAPEPNPALQYELLPSAAERRPGNRATNYYRAILHETQWLAQLSREERKQHWDNQAKWSELALAELPQEDVRKWLAAYQGSFRELKEAAYREHCEFDLRTQDLRGFDTVGFVLHDFQEMRTLARALVMRARLELAEGNQAAAIETLRQGYQLAQDATEPPLLINALIGIAIAGTMNEVLVELIDQPGSANMYWAVTALPRPLVDMQRALRAEMELPVRMFPFLKDAETVERSAEEWQRLMAQALQDIQGLGGMGPSHLPSWQAKLAVAGALLKAYPEAKQLLLEAGYPQEKLDKMPVAQVVAIQASRANRHAYHEMFKWSLLPYPESNNRMEEAVQKLQREGYLGGRFAVNDPLMISSLLLPAVSNTTHASARIDREFAALRALEAIRMHAAVNGTLPASLADVAIVPVPENPATGEAFPYAVQDGVARLTLPTVGHQSAKVYEITLEPAVQK